MRKYQPIWDRVKAGETVSITADEANHTTIRIGVRTEKNRDYSFKVLCAERGKKYRLICDKKGKKLTFHLQLTVASML